MNPKVIIKKKDPVISGYKWEFTTIVDDLKYTHGIVNGFCYSLDSHSGLTRDYVKLLSYHYTLMDRFLAILDILFRSTASYTPDETKEFIKSSFQYEYPTDVEFGGF